MRISTLILFCCIVCNTHLFSQDTLLIQNFDDTTQIQADDVWSGVSGITGYIEGNCCPSSPRYVGCSIDDVTIGDITVNADASKTTAGSGGYNAPGIYELEDDVDSEIGLLAGSTTGNAVPHLQIDIDASHHKNIRVECLVDYLGTSCETTGDFKEFAVLYRTNSCECFRNVPAAWIEDITMGAPHQVDVLLPATANFSDNLQIALATVYENNSSCLITIDDITITADTCEGGKIRTVTSNDDNGPGTLRDTILAACPGDTILFDPATDLTEIELIDDITIDKDLVLIGNGIQNTIIDGGNTTRLFKIIDGADVQFHHMQMKDGDGYYSGSAIQITNVIDDNSCSSYSGVSSLSETTVSHCWIRNMEAYRRGGAIYNGGGDLFVMNTLMEDCRTTAYEGGAIYTEKRDTSYADGEPLIQINDVTIQNCEASGNGGGIYTYGELVVDASVFKNNCAGCQNTGSLSRGDGSGEGNGGAIYHRNTGPLTVDTSRFIGNDAANCGGGIFIQEYEPGGQMITGGGEANTVHATAFVNNQSEEHGGAIFSSDDLEVSFSLFRSNQAGVCEDDFDASGDVNRGRDIYSKTGNGGAIWQDHCVLLTVDSSRFYLNRAFGSGGAIFLNGSNNPQLCGMNDAPDSDGTEGNSFSRCVFDANRSITDCEDFLDIQPMSRGFALYNPHSTGGGAIFVGRFNTLSMEACLARLNRSDNKGGALLVDEYWYESDDNAPVTRGSDPVLDDAYPVNIQYCLFRGNRAKNDGGGLYLGNRTRIDSTRIRNSRSNNRGGGIYIADMQAFDLDQPLQRGAPTSAPDLPDVHITYSGIITNFARFSGGGLYNNGSRVLLDSVRIYGNRTEGSGGGIYNASNCPATQMEIKRSWIARDSARVQGGGIYNDRNTCTIIDSTTIRSCIASYVLNGALGQPIQTQRGASSFGGGVYSRGLLYISRSTISRNHGRNGGGGLYLSYSSSDGCILPDNADMFGPYQTRIWTSTISNNNTNYRGGGIHSTQNTDISNSTIVRNTGLTKGSWGGGIHFTNTCRDLILRANIIAENLAGTGNDIYANLNEPCGKLPPPIRRGGVLEGHNLVGDTVASGWVMNFGDTVGSMSGTILDPVIGPLQNNGGWTRTHAILCGSPAFDAGDGQRADQRGEDIFGGSRDIGAFESQADISDLDGDGYCTESEDPNEELDCEDDNPDINPGEEEICGNQVDENCDGEIQLEDPETGVCCALGDNDEYYIPSVASLLDGIYVNDGPSPNGYWDYSDTYFGSPYHPYLYFQFTPGGTLSLKHWLAWVDWNDNGVFEPSEKIVDYCTSITFAQFVVMPSYAAVGPHLMRLVMIADEEGNGCFDDPYDPNACGEMGAGEVEDFTVCKGGFCGGQMASPEETLVRPIPNDVVPSFFDEGMSVFPNPFSERILVKLGAQMQGGGVIELMNASGQILLSKDIDLHESDELISLDGSLLSAGYYLVRYKTDYGTFSQKVIKN